MSAAPLPPNERERLEILGRYAILDTLPDQQFDDLTFLAAQICGTPISLISLVDRDRQWFKSRHGIDATETPRDLSFCAHAILEGHVMEVPDATLDVRFRENGLVTGVPDIRFYAGAPLITPDGVSLGTLCVIDRQPRHLSELQLKALEALARQAISQMELWRTVKRLEAADAARQQALSHLAANAALLRQFVEHVPAAIAMLDRDLRYVAVSRRFLSDNGMAGRNLIGESHYEIFPNLPERWKEGHQRVLQGAIESSEADEYVRDDGQIEFLQWEIRPWRDARGHIGGIIMLTELITERIRSQRIKNEFIGVVSHELRTPLTSIRGALGLLAGGVAGQLPDSAHQMIEIAQKNSERLVLLINDILDVEKIESGKMRFDMKVLNVCDLLDTVLEADKNYAGTLDVTLECEPLAEELKRHELLLMADEGRLQQVLSNLLSNAAKFTPEGGVVKVEIQVVQYSARPWIRTLIRDQGTGVPEEFVSRLFEKFAQADSSSTRKKGGTGLGLAIARAIIEKHGGRIDYLSPAVPGQGATFFFDLPLWREEVLN